MFRDERESSLQYLTLVYKKRIGLILFIAIATLIAGGITFLIPKKYASTAIIYPANDINRNDIMQAPQFGFEVETERLMQMLNSAVIRDRVIKRFDLITYYEVDTNKAQWKYHLIKNYVQDIGFSRTEFLSIQIFVKTKKPELSAEICDFIVEEVNQYKTEIFEKNRKQEYEYALLSLKRMQDKLQSVINQIYQEKDSTVSNQIIENFLNMASKENYVKNDFIQNETMAKLIDEYKYFKDKYYELRSQVDYTKKLMDRPFLKNYVIEHAKPSYKKVSPSLLTNLIIGFSISSIIAFSWLAFVNKFSGNNDDEVE